mgnify:CR=1 FL=1
MLVVLYLGRVEDAADGAMRRNSTHASVEPFLGLEVVRVEAPQSIDTNGPVLVNAENLCSC